LSQLATMQKRLQIKRLRQKALIFAVFTTMLFQVFWPRAGFSMANNNALI
jgi:hypothetical protein